METFTTVVTDIIPRTPTVKSFRLKLETPMEFAAGQFISVCLHGEKELTRSLSLSNAPTETDYLEVTKRITDSRFSMLLDEAEPGLEVAVKGPMGRFSFAGETDKIALLSGGIGITPLRSMAKYVVDKGLGTSVVLVYSNRSEDEIAFRQDFDDMAANPNVDVLYTITRASEGWSGRSGRIDADLIRELVPDFQQRTFFTCGPKTMVGAITDMLLDELALSKEQVKKENFTGY